MASNTSVGSGSSSRTRSRASPLLHQVVCYHNEVAPLRVVRFDGLTKGKHFYGCSYWPTCGFFKWVDEIAKLEAEKDELKEKIRRLKARKEKLVDEVVEMGIATTETN
ncbi:Endonuclease 8-like 3, partial [Bienertia sinuspersici]